MFAQIWKFFHTPTQQKPKLFNDNGCGSAHSCPTHHVMTIDIPPPIMGRVSSLWVVLTIIVIALSLHIHITTQELQCTLHTYAYAVELRHQYHSRNVLLPIIITSAADTTPMAPFHALSASSGWTR